MSSVLANPLNIRGYVGKRLIVDQISVGYVCSPIILPGTLFSPTTGPTPHKVYYLAKLVKIKLPGQACYVYPHHHVKMHDPKQLPIPVIFYVTQWQHDVHPIGLCKGQLLLRITEVLVARRHRATKNKWEGCQACSSRCSIECALFEGSRRDLTFQLASYVPTYASRSTRITNTILSIRVNHGRFANPDRINWPGLGG